MGTVGWHGVYSQIGYEVSDRVATITLDRPEKLNAFTGTMMREMIDAFDRADADDGVRAVIVTGAGRAYCAGADLAAGGETFAEGGSDVQTDVGVPRDGGGMLTLRIFDCMKPVIGAINGVSHRTHLCIQGLVIHSHLMGAILILARHQASAIKCSSNLITGG